MNLDLERYLLHVGCALMLFTTHIRFICVCKLRRREKGNYRTGRKTQKRCTKKRQSLHQLCQSQTASQYVVFSSAANLVPFRGDDPEKMHAHSRSPFYCLFDMPCKDQFGFYQLQYTCQNKEGRISTEITDNYNTMSKTRPANRSKQAKNCHGISKRVRFFDKNRQCVPHSQTIPSPYFSLTRADSLSILAQLKNGPVHYQAQKETARRAAMASLYNFPTFS